MSKSLKKIVKKEVGKTILRYKDLYPLTSYNNPEWSDVLDLLEVTTPSELISLSNQELYGYFGGYEHSLNPINVYALIKRTRYEYKTNKPQKPFDSQFLNSWIKDKEWFKKAPDTEYFLSLPEMFRQYGIVLCYLPSVPNGIFGYLEWIDGVPALCVTDKFQDLASSWITLLTLLDHILNFPGNPLFLDKILSFERPHDPEQLVDYDIEQLIYGQVDIRKYISERNPKYLGVEDLKKFSGTSDFFAEYWIRRKSFQFKNTRRIPVNFSDIQIKIDKAPSDDPYEELLHDIKTQMALSNISQKRLAELLNVSSAYLSNVLKGKKEFGIKFLIEIYRCLGKRIKFLSY